MAISKNDLTEKFENELLECFLDELSERPSKVLNIEGSPMYTSYEALEVLQKAFLKSSRRFGQLFATKIFIMQISV